MSSPRPTCRLPVAPDTDCALRASLRGGMWRREEPKDLAALKRLAAEARLSFPHLDAIRDLEWMAVGHGWPERELLVLVDRAGEKVTGFVALSVANTLLEYSVGPLVLRRLPVRQINLYQDIAVDRSDCKASMEACLDTLSTVVPPDAVLRFGAVPVGSELHRQLADPSSRAHRRFHVLPSGDETQHCRIRWTGDFEVYLASLGKVSRKELRRNMRALLNDTSLKCEVRRFQTASDVDAFLRDGIAISDKTYQKRDLGLGLSLGGDVERSIRLATDLGGFFGCILYIDDAPVAFEYGFIWGGVCVMKQAGYDPAWAARSVGSVLFTAFVRELAELGVEIRWLDLVPGRSVFKLRTTNEKLAIQNFYLFPRSYIGAGRHLTLAGTAWASRVGRRLIRRKTRDVEQYRKRPWRNSTSAS